jgi:hypothetical protein
VRGGHALDVVRHRADTDGTERDRDTLPTTAFIKGN